MAKQADETHAPKAFISYTHEDEEHNAWVLKLATDLRLNGVDATLDRWDLHPGQIIYPFMENGIREADRVLLVCTPHYLTKAREGKGGVGFENLVVTAEMANNLGTDKFVCIMRRSASHDLPAHLATRLYIDFTDDATYVEKLDELLRGIHSVPANKPELGDYDPNRSPILHASVRVLSSEVSEKPPVGSSPYEAQPALSVLSPDVFDQSHSPSFHQHFLDRVRKSSKVIMIGTGLNLLQGGPAATEIMELVRDRQCEVEVYLADPDCPDVEARLIEEEMGSTKPPVGQSGLAKNLKFLVNTWSQFGDLPGFDVRLFTHYPTFALLVADGDYYVYPYGYATLGNYSPVFHFSGNKAEHRKVVAFFEDQYEQIKASAYDARLFFEQPTQQHLADEALNPFALYFIPPVESGLYRFGADVLGYDVRNPKAPRDSRWPEFVATPSRFGFHLTLCDALYFWSPEHLERVRAEIAHLAGQYAPFKLTNLRVKVGFPNKESVAIGATDPSGTLQMLHHELVQRIYRRAAGSDYTLGMAKADRGNDQQRGDPLAQRFRAPYILQRYQPHFTLATAVPATELDAVGSSLKEEFDHRVRHRSITVSELAIMRMTRPRPYERWEIEETVELGGRSGA